jgi:hypothetical protein
MDANTETRTMLPLLVGNAPSEFARLTGVKPNCLGTAVAVPLNVGAH